MRSFKDGKNPKKPLEMLKRETTEYIKKITKDLPNPANEEFFRLTLELGTRHQESLLSWLEYTKQRVRHLNKNDTED